MLASWSSAGASKAAATTTAAQTYTAHCVLCTVISTLVTFANESNEQKAIGHCYIEGRLGLRAQSIKTSQVGWEWVSERDKCKLEAY